MTSEIDEALINSLTLEVPQTTDRKLLYAGLAVLSRDIFYYLQDNPRDDSSWFDDVIERISGEEIATFDDGAFPYYDSHDTDQLPSGLAEAAAAGRFTFAPLLDGAIDHEWTSHPGELLQRRFLVRLGTSWKQAVGGADGPYETTQKGDAGPHVLAMKLTATVLDSAGLSEGPFWYPIAVYVGLILSQTGL